MRAALAAAVLLLSAPVWAEEETPEDLVRELVEQQGGVVPEAEPEEDADPHMSTFVFPLEKGDTAPFDGLLLGEDEAFTCAQMNLQVDALMGRMQNRDRMISDLEGQLGAALEAREPSWWQRNGFTIGMVLGTIVAGVSVWASVNVLEATR